MSARQGEGCRCQLTLLSLSSIVVAVNRIKSLLSYLSVRSYGRIGKQQIEHHIANRSDRAFAISEAVRAAPKIPGSIPRGVSGEAW